MKFPRRICFLLALLVATVAPAAFLSNPDLAITGAATQTAAGNNIILASAGSGATDALGFRSFDIQIIPAGTVSSGVVTFEVSEDNTTFTAVPVYDVNAPTSAPATNFSPATGVNRHFYGAVSGRYLRARISTVIGGGGSIAAVTRLSPVSFHAVVDNVTVNGSVTVTATNLSANVAQINGVTPLMGNGTTGTGSLRVTVSSDNTAFGVNAAQSGTWTVQPGNTANTTPWLIAGAAASGASKAGNPLQVGGVFNTTQPTVTTGQAVEAQATARGALIVAAGVDNTAANAWFTKLTDGTNTTSVKAASTAAAFTDAAATVDVRPGGIFPASAAMADATATPTVTKVAAHGMTYNGSTWDFTRAGNSTNLTTGDTGAKTATGNGATITSVGNKGVQIFIVLGTVSGTSPTCTFKVQGSVDGGTNWYDIPGATTASLTASTNVGITIYPGIAVTAGTTTTGSTAGASGVVPRSWRMVWTIGGTTPSFTITSVSYNYIAN